MTGGGEEDAVVVWLRALQPQKERGEDYGQ